MKMDSVSRCYNLIWLRMLLMCVIFCVVRVQAQYLRKQNVAVGKPAKISTTYEEDNDKSGPACLAVDGSRDTKYTSKGSKSVSCVKSAKGDNAPSWEVNLNNKSVINHIMIFWNEATKDQNAGAILQVNGEQCSVFNKIERNPSEAWCNTTGGNIIMISLTGDKVGSDNFLQLCEVEAWVCFPGFWGKYCNDSCSRNCKNNIVCDPVTGECVTPIKKQREECILPTKAAIFAGLSIPIAFITFTICRVTGWSQEEEPPAEKPAEGEEKEKEGQQGEEGEKEGEKEGEGGEGGEEAASDAGSDDEGD
ncbi:uncharacterized protein LOC112572919 isoform X2 [Pomacea canaliculata]|uniref:uncharacterized protein LOC112572919 isoform X2 n=1 Tax=Pomacea canaliculata TaxID=400727 RepID=UPI000D72AF2C|nr:uncharacterized protein LOC112572919 isoform X2 [Pomacea canaliculata]